MPGHSAGMLQGRDGEEAIFSIPLNPGTARYFEVFYRAATVTERLLDLFTPSYALG
jgi:hypothetical protein